MRSGPSGKIVGAGVTLLIAAALATVLMSVPAEAGETYGCGTLVCVSIETTYVFEGCSAGACAATMYLILVGDAVPFPMGHAEASASVDCIAACPPFGQAGAWTQCAWLGVASRCEGSDPTTLHWNSSDPCGLFYVEADGRARYAVLGPGNRPLVIVEPSEVTSGYKEIVLICNDGSVQTAYV